jgi:uncharacterized protein YoxC
MQRSMTGLININSINDINTTGNINSNTIEYSNAEYFTGLNGNIQQQFNALSTNASTIIYYSISSYFYQNVNDNNIISNGISSISGLLYNTINIMNYNYNIFNNNNINQINYSNSLSGIIYGNFTNQKVININTSNYINNLSYNVNSLSGLIYNSQILNYNNFLNQNILNQSYSNYLNNLQNQVNSNNQSASQASTGNTIGNIVNGIASVGIAAGTAFLFTTVFSTLASLQSQATTESLFTQDLSQRLSALTTRVKELEKQVRYLQQDVNEPLKGLLYRCELINRNTFNGDFFINGTIQQSNVNPFATNVFSSNAIFYSNVQINGILYDSSQHITDLLQF